MTKEPLGFSGGRIVYKQCAVAKEAHFLPAKHSESGERFFGRQKVWMRPINLFFKGGVSASSEFSRSAGRLKWQSMHKDRHGHPRNHDCYCGQESEVPPAYPQDP